MYEPDIQQSLYPHAQGVYAPDIHQSPYQQVQVNENKGDLLQSIESNWSNLRTSAEMDDVIDIVKKISQQLEELEEQQELEENQPIIGDKVVKEIEGSLEEFADKVERNMGIKLKDMNEI